MGTLAVQSTDKIPNVAEITNVSEIQLRFLGHAPHSSSIVGPLSVEGSISSVGITLGPLQHGDTLYFTVVCSNPMNLKSLVVTLDGVPVVMEPPDVTAARVHVVAQSLTHFPTRGQHQPNNQSVVFGWSGVQDISGIDYSQVLLNII